MPGDRLLEISDLSIGFTGRSGETLPVLRNVDLAVEPGESVGLVGESGSGKSTLALAAMGYLKRGLRVLGGTAAFRSKDTFKMSQRELEQIRGGEISLIPQNSGQSLTPTMRVGSQLLESLSLHSDMQPSEQRGRMIELLAQVRLPDPEAILERYPHELSGGQQQRVAISMALAGDSDALLLDEPTTGLDVTTQAHILELLRDLARETRKAMVYVSHDLGAIARVCDRVLVMYAGEVVLEGLARNVLLAPVHPYARGLLASIPKLNDARLPDSLEGRPPPPGGAGKGCAFEGRCSIARSECRTHRPALARCETGELVRCPYSSEVPALSNPNAIDAAEKQPAPSRESALAIESLAISYAKPGIIEQILGRRPKSVPTVDDISIKIGKGETVGLVGESGSGKSTILKTIAGLLPPAAGEIRIGNDERLETDVERRSPKHRRMVQLVFQNPDESLNPRHTVEQILAQPLKLYFGMKPEETRNRINEILESVRLGSHYADRLPSQLSGGEKQRVAIARAFVAKPDIVLCDEVTSALDVSVQAAVLQLLDRLKRERGTTYVFVSHDLAVVRSLSDRVAVLYQGRLCELGPAKRVYASPSHPYTDVLLGAVLEPHPDFVPELAADDIVELAPPAAGCPFQRRCPKKLGSVCETTAPPWRECSDGHSIRCHLEPDMLRSTGRTDKERSAAI